MIFGNVFINKSDEVAIQHDSAGLGAAVYHQETGTLQQTQGFEWCCRDFSDRSSTQAKREVFRQHENWVSVDDDAIRPTPDGLPMQLFSSLEKWAGIIDL